MSYQTLLYIILAGIAALLLALFQYKYKTKSASNKTALFVILRTITLFSVFLLLINPEFEQLTITTEKPTLVVAVDNSSSIKHLNQDDKVNQFLIALKENTAINDRFTVDLYSFGSLLQSLDTLGFSENQTNISSAFSSLHQIYKNTVSPTLLITDGNQTFGNDYEFSAKKYNQKIYPIILGDTTLYVDIKLQQLNVNKYVFLKNKFPVEAIAVYSGNSNFSTTFQVTQGNAVVFSKIVSFSKTKTSEVISFNLPANKVGVHAYKATLVPINTEKNKVNNVRDFAVEVIDQKTNVALVSALLHPDLGALKKSIETNEQRSVTLFKPNELLGKLDDFQLVIVYQPDNSFSQLFAEMKDVNKNKFVITGTKTDWTFLNAQSENYRQDITSQTEDYQAHLNTSYSAFIVEDLNFVSLPPLVSSFGAPEFSVPLETLLYKTVGNFKTDEPLLATFEVGSKRESILFGENIWRWRAQNYRNTESFNEFDNFFGKIIQYLSSNKRKNRLELDYDSFYQGATNVVIKAHYFNKNYEFDKTETLSLSIENKDNTLVKAVPFLLNNNVYEADLNDLPAGEYSFTVRTKSENISKEGQFKILEYSVEQQFYNANASKLEYIAKNSNGQSYYIDNYSEMFNNLSENEAFKPLQKSNKSTVPLIDWKYLLALITLSLSIEWFLRKYKGLI
ncbi:VWA domain-containing protein [Bizionia saleffrena]|uniref:VWA domain-containing protein n=1 Tax=Bizionia saleffrena TaxID=291189 RepID=A0A8H2LG55_9FLAO|nr:VWA domain-containing protein [Bizionia saleffrena]TYB76731.1 VWA domain-containing protein [Bizionia saleffrena]